MHGRAKYHFPPNTESDGTVSQTLTLERNDKYRNDDEDPKVIEKKKLSGCALQELKLVSLLLVLL